MYRQIISVSHPPSNILVKCIDINQVFSQIAEMEPIEPTDVQFGLDLLRELKEEIGIQPPRMSLGFLLIACAKAKDKHRSYAVWREYKTAGLPYNIVTYLRLVA